MVVTAWACCLLILDTYGASVIVRVLSRLLIRRVTLQGKEGNPPGPLTKDEFFAHNESGVKLEEDKIYWILGTSVDVATDAYDEDIRCFLVSVAANTLESL